MLVMDELIKTRPENIDIPMDLINIYEMVERDLKRCPSLVNRLRYYAAYSAMLYVYIEMHLGKGSTYSIFELARLTVLYDEQLMVSFKSVPHNIGQSVGFFKKTM